MKNILQNQQSNLFINPDRHIFFIFHHSLLPEKSKKQENPIEYYWIFLLFISLALFIIPSDGCYTVGSLKYLGSPTLLVWFKSVQLLPVFGRHVGASQVLVEPQ